MTALVVIFSIAVVAWATVFGTIAGVVWRSRGGNASDGFLIGAFFGVFGVAFCALATPKRKERGRVPAEPADPAEVVPEILRPNANPRVILPWRERRIGLEGWAAVGVCVVVMGLAC